MVCCGSGGVGKTSVAAALALAAAEHRDGKVLVLTVDPARRLATALGIEGIGNLERQVDPELLRKMTALSNSIEKKFSNASSGPCTFWLNDHWKFPKGCLTASLTSRNILWDF